ncbi:hypothetical protein WK13_34720 [Burkholderia ubonensis]|uniref:hypothetical protein n=1 Tax=Burkholderia ubonensis TaxID=101571 RepID=UPI00075E2FBB|nr:hypothetical protein [Burkholderia ubonensis]KVR21694.1 hypothetical protein WK13_34720 [Burkholderia ubonensis]
MGYKIEEPVVQPDTTFKEGTRTTHPAFGQISVSRVTGGRVLYGSDFQHQNFVRITISTSSLRRDLSNDWPFAEKELIEVDMSEAQWATFVSSFNIGSGVQCTLARVNNQDVPQLPDPPSRTEQFAGEATKTMKRSMEALRELELAVMETNLSNKAKQELLGKVQTAMRNVAPNVEFVANQFGEFMEHTVEKAKVEVNAYVMQAVHQVGLAAIKGGATPILSFSGGKKTGTLPPSDVQDVDAKDA